MAENKNTKKVKLAKEEAYCDDISYANSDLLNNVTNINYNLNNTRAVSAIKEFACNTNLRKIALGGSKQLQKVLLEILKNELKMKLSILQNDENLVDNIRRSVLLRYKSSKDVYEGEVTDIKITKDDYDQVNSIFITLKTSKSTKTVQVDKYLYNSLSNINVGDAVYIEANLGIIKRLGRSESYQNEYDLEAEKYVPLSKNPVYFKKDAESIISLYDLDYAFNKYNSEITNFTRQSVDNFVKTINAEFIEGCVVTENIPVDLNEYLSLKWVLLAQKKPQGFLFVNPKEKEEPYNLLACSKEFEEVVKEYATDSNLDKIENALKISQTPSDFRNLMAE